MADLQFNPDAQRLYGISPQGDLSGYIQTRAGANHYVGGAAGQGQNKFGNNSLPDLTQYLRDRAAFDDPDNPPKTLSTLPASDLMQYVKDYGTTHIPPVLESHYRAKVDKGQIESHVNQFTSKFMNDLPKWRQHFADIEKQAGVVAPPQPQGAASDLGDLAKSVGGTLESSAAQAVQGTGRTVADALRSPLNPVSPILNAIAPKVDQLAQSFGAKPGEGVMTDFLRKKTAAGQALHESVSAEYKKKTGEDAPLSLIKAADVVGNIAAQAAPIIGSAMVNPGLALVTGAGQMGEQSKEQEMQRIMGMKPEEISQLPAFQKLVSEGLNPQEAQAKLAEAAGETAFKTGASVGSIAGLLGAGPVTAVGKAALTKVFGKSLIARILGAAGAEGSGQSVLSALMEGANTHAVNDVTGENRVPDLAGAAGRGFEFGAVLGPLGMAVGGKAKPNELKGGKLAEAPTEQPSAAAKPAAQAQGYTDLAPAVINQFAPEGKDQTHVNTQMGDALDLLQQRMKLGDEEFAPIKDQFIKDYTSKYGVAAEAPTAAAAPQVNEASVSPEDAAAATAQAKEEIAPQPIKPEEPPAVQTPAQILDTHKANLDNRLGDGLLNRAVEKLQAEGKNNPTPDEINQAAHKELGILMQLTKDTNDLKGTTDADATLHREAINKLLEDGKEITPESVAEAKKSLNVNKQVADRLKSRFGLKARPKENPLPKSDAVEQGRETAKSEMEFQQPATNELNFKSKLDEAVSKGWISSEHANFAKWLVQKSPKLVKDLGLEISGPGEGPGGRYNPLGKLVQIFSSGASNDTAVHEVMHHSERMMPENIRNGIAKAWKKALDAEIAKAGPERKAALEALQKYGTDQKAREIVAQAGSQEGTGPHLDLGKDYALSNPSEFWAVNASRILKNRFSGEYSWAKKAYNWLKEFTEKAKDIFGLQSDAPVIRGLDKVLKGSGEFQPNAKMLASHLVSGDFSFESPSIKTGSEDWEKPFNKSLIPSWGSGKEAPNTDDPSAWQKFTQKWGNTLKPLEYLNEKMATLGHKLSESTNIFMHFTNLAGRQGFEQSRVNANYIAPFKDLVRVIAEGKGWNEGKLLHHFSDWIRAQDALETNRRGALEKVRLNDIAEGKRADLKLAVHEGRLSPAQYLGELKKIVNEPGAKLESLDSVSPLSGMKRDDAIAKLKEANDAGLTDEEGEALNKMLDPVRESIFKDNQKSGVFSKAALDVARSYGSKYYVPKTGFADEDFQQGSSFGSPLGAFTKEAWMQEGRKTLADDPIQNLFRKALNAAKDIADNEAIKSVYEFASNKELNTVLKASVRTVNMDRLTRDTLGAGGRLSDIQRASKNPNTIIYNEGKFRHFIELPEDSQVLRAIKESQSPVQQGEFMKAAGKANAFLGRAYTAWSPTFSLVTAPIRDGIYVPGMFVLQGKLSWVPTYVKHYMAMGGPFGAWGTYLKGLRAATVEEMQAKAKANPESTAGYLYRLDQAGGLTGFKHEFESAKKLESLAAELVKDKQAAFDPRKVTRYAGNLIDAFASGSINAGRIAAFKTALEHGASEKEAAFLSRRLLDYQQTSQGSRGMNSLFVFSRVGINSVDAMFGALKNEKGQIDSRRAMGAMAVTTVAAGALYEVLKAYLGDKSKKITDDALAKNMVLPNPWDPETPIQLPIGLGGPRLAWGLAMMGVRLAEGHTTAASAGRTVKNLLLENVSPLHPIEAKEGASAGESARALGAALVPTIAQPLYEEAINQNHFGTPIHTPSERTKGFASDAGWASTADMWKTLAKSLHEHTGLDMYPETLNHLATSYSPGAMNIAIAQIKKADMEKAGLPVNASQGTLFSALFNHDMQYAPKRELDKVQNQLEDAPKQVTALKEQNKPIPAALEKQDQELKKIRSEESKHSKSVKSVQKNALLSANAKAAQIKVLNDAWEKEQSRLANEANRMVQ